MVRKLALTIFLTGVAGIASATPSGVTCTTHWLWGVIPYEVCTVASPPKPVVAAPEINAASAAAGLTLMIGALAVLRGRRRNVAKT